MSVIIVGTCGNCGGSVEVPKVWMGIIPPVPTCRTCGAIPKNVFGPRLPMNPSPRRREQLMLVVDDDEFERLDREPSQPTSANIRGAKLLNKLIQTRK